jgi:DNA polymerase III epsilon subunit-like protein
MRIMFFDTETTDLLKITGAPLTKQPRVTEFYGIVHNERAEQVDMLHFLCDPKQPLTPLITKITGLRDIDLVGKPEFPAYAKQVKTLIESVDEVVAHNLRFDMDVVGTSSLASPATRRRSNGPKGKSVPSSKPSI